MAFHIELTPDAVELRIIGAVDRFLCFSRGQVVALGDVADARVVSWREARSQMGWRVRGSYVPGWIATGWYTVPGRKGARQLWAVLRDRSSLLVVDTTLDRPARLVIATPDAAALADRINGAS